MGGDVTGGGETAGPTSIPSAGLQLEYCGEWTSVPPGAAFTVGRSGDLVLDDNSELDPALAEFSDVEGIWFLRNTGTQTSLSVADGEGRFHSQVPPGCRIPVVFGHTAVVFRAGPTTYEIGVYVAAPIYSAPAPAGADRDRHAERESLGEIVLTLSQRQLIVALVEPLLRSESAGLGDIPTSARAAARLGWTLTRFNRKLDNVCDKLDRHGVPGLRGGVGAYATNRRIRLVEFAVAARVVTRMDLRLLDLADPVGDGSLS
ncbi:hypothetical protein CSIV_15660 [Microbacterium sp. CSI-V]|nr:hypothetical protein [Microbacterium sp. TL13]MXS74253.1 hypothetical protein [Microbacterium sp. TL13]ONI62880.1 hypothetical protein CSIV_15660 [Microbacterium sp. CSI-V]